MVVLVSFLGLAVDVASLHYDERRLKAAAQTAALAAALEVNQCAGTNACPAMQVAAVSALAENGITVKQTFLNCAQSSGSGFALTINNPPCANGAADPNHGNSNYVEVSVAELEPTYFAKVIGFNGMMLSARAEAARTGNPNCIYALDRSNVNAISVDILATLNANCGVIDESNSSLAFGCNVLSAVHVPRLRVTGGSESLLCNVSPHAQTGVPLPNPVDPLAYLPTPSLQGCGTTTSSPYTGSPNPLLIVGNATLYPGRAYCGGIVLLPTAHVTFMPGTYVIRSGGLLGLQGGMSIDVAATATGNGVTFYNYGPIGGVNFVLSSIPLGSVSLKAPTSGTYAGVLFYQDPANTTPAVILANSSWNTVLEGAYYFPTALVTCAATGLSNYNILVAKDILFAALSFGTGSQSTTTFGNNYSTLSAGSPLAGGGSVLVQ